MICLVGKPSKHAVHGRNFSCPQVKKFRDIDVWESYITPKGWTRFLILMVLLVFPMLKNQAHQTLVYCYLI